MSEVRLSGKGILNHRLTLLTVLFGSIAGLAYVLTLYVVAVLFAGLIILNLITYIHTRKPL